MFLEFDEYLLGARKLLSIYGFKCHQNDDDAISYVAYYMIKADDTWDGTKSSRDTWRFNQAKYAIGHLKEKHGKQKRLVSLNTVVGTKRSRDIYLADMIEDKRNNTMAETFKSVMDYAKGRLSQRQYDCLQMHYQDDMTMDNIGKKLGITKQMVSLHIRKAIGIIRDECKSKIDCAFR